ncbi:LacI family DNA-binding transcriptional regulator [Prolixibacter sp. NT017]|uniref:LacI family DNA-binding transcriptional regulator n=1 Tax=Prolixibacter sp. NT017 TaxID=2652390 RepID=UPI00126D781F|nr:LacI family DNA-binding transcriptional regulator [Prolixibacter sp. NT017]GET24042.1 LacI family transcriptional regulator [Prolixibacter sp. NT017]
MGNRYISLKDLANELHVSISTVSRALKDHPDISVEMRQKVKKLAQERNYSPNPLAMGLLKQTTGMIGVIVPDVVTHFYASIIAGIESLARKKGYFVVIASSGESYEKEVEAVENLVKARVDGLIVCLSQETQTYHHFEKIIEQNIPLVFFDRVCLENRVSCVTADNIDASKRIVHHFKNQGYKRIAFISGPRHLNISKERLAGYMEGLNEAGYPFSPELVEQCNLSLESAKSAMSRLLQLPNPPDAVFGINDTVAFGAMKEIKEQKLRIPKDIGLVGFTDEFHATVVEPPLTSITHPTFKIGQEAAKQFFKRMKYQDTHHVSILKTNLIERASSVRNR